MRRQTSATWPGWCRVPSGFALEAALWTGRAARLARITTSTWQRLALLAGPAPKPSRQSGRVHVVQHGTDVHETQAIRMTDANVVTWLTDPQDPRELTEYGPGPRGAGLIHSRRWETSGLFRAG
ncbi:hypothetical protein ACFW2Y_28930 [Streptomyces sp. NPDC058877]|uniref:hypothetical protein n=1 Tax=unclassified Streptomyces TaxID=2593676 RepID=UPI0036CF7C00